MTLVKNNLSPNQYFKLSSHEREFLKSNISIKESFRRKHNASIDEQPQVQMGAHIVHTQVVRTQDIGKI